MRADAPPTHGIAGDQRDADFIESFEQAYEGFQAASGSGGAIDAFFDIGGHTVRLRMAGTGLFSAITPALEHLAVPPISAPALTVCMWDSESTRTPLPAFLSGSRRGSGAGETYA